MLVAAGDLAGNGTPPLLARSDYDGPIAAISCATGAELWSIPGRQYSLRRPLMIGDVSGDGSPDVAFDEWNEAGTAIELHIHCAFDGRELEVRLMENVSLADGTVDLDGDGMRDLLATRNVWGDEAEELGDDVWRAGRVEVLSGRDASILFEFDGDDLTPIANR